MSRELASQGLRRGIDLLADACTSCMLCVRECPTWCIELTSHTEQITEEGARRPRTVNVLDAFTIDFGLCMYCGICIEVCPFDALEWSSTVEPATKERRSLAEGILELRPSDS